MTGKKQKYGFFMENAVGKEAFFRQEAKERMETLTTDISDIEYKTVGSVILVTWFGLKKEPEL